MDILYADDLNVYKAFQQDAADERLLDDAEQIQCEFHNWGKANQVT